MNQIESILCYDPKQEYDTFIQNLEGFVNCKRLDILYIGGKTFFPPNLIELFITLKRKFLNINLSCLHQLKQLTINSNLTDKPTFILPKSIQYLYYNSTTAIIRNLNFLSIKTIIDCSKKCVKNNSFIEYTRKEYKF